MRTPAEANLEENEAIRDLASQRPSRADGTLIPLLRAPEGWVHLSVATAKIAWALFGAKGQHWWQYFAAALDVSDFARNIDRRSDEAKARNIEILMDNIAEVSRYEVLITGFRQVGGGGEVCQLSGDCWDTEDLGLRFRHWSIDPCSSLRDAPDLPCWIWVESDSLDRLIRSFLQYDARITESVVIEPGWVRVPDALKRIINVASSDAITVLAELCGAGAVPSIAAGYERFYRGKRVESGPKWTIPAYLWGDLQLDARTNVADGTFWFLDGDNEYRVSGTYVDGDKFSKALTARTALHSIYSSVEEAPVEHKPRDQFTDTESDAVTGWADSAVRRGVTVAGADADWKQNGGDFDVPRRELREALKACRASLGVVTKQGRAAPEIPS